MNKESFTEQVLAAEQTMYRVSKSILIYDSDCEDAVQEAILKAYAGINGLKNEAFFKTWLIRILINECYKILRRNKKSVSIDEIGEIGEAEDYHYSELYTAIHRLGEKYRPVTVLYYIEGYSVEETGEILKIPPGTVKSRLSKARTLLKNYLTEED